MYVRRKSFLGGILADSVNDKTRKIGSSDHGIVVNEWDWDWGIPRLRRRGGITMRWANMLGHCSFVGHGPLPVSLLCQWFYYGPWVWDCVFTGWRCNTNSKVDFTRRSSLTRTIITFYNWLATYIVSGRQIAAYRKSLFSLSLSESLQNFRFARRAALWSMLLTSQNTFRGLQYYY